MNIDLHCCIFGYIRPHVVLPLRHSQAPNSLDTEFIRMISCALTYNQRQDWDDAASASGFGMVTLLAKVVNILDPIHLI